MKVLSNEDLRKVRGLGLSECDVDPEICTSGGGGGGGGGCMLIKENCYYTNDSRCESGVSLLCDLRLVCEDGSTFYGESFDCF